MDNYRIEAFDENNNPCTNSCIIEAPDIGPAIEYFLAIHGMISYCKIIYGRTDDPADESYTSFVALMGILTPEKIEELNNWHSENTERKWKGEGK